MQTYILNDAANLVNFTTPAQLAVHAWIPGNNKNFYTHSGDYDIALVYVTGIISILNTIHYNSNDEPRWHLITDLKWIDVLPNTNFTIVLKRSNVFWPKYWFKDLGTNKELGIPGWKYMILKRKNKKTNEKLYINRR